MRLERESTNLKLKYMKELDITNKDKALVESRLSNIVYESERNRAVLKEADQRIMNIERRLKSIEFEKLALEEKFSGSQLELERVEQSVKLKRSEMSDLTSKLFSTNAKIDKIASTEGVFNTRKVGIDGRLNVLLRIQSHFEAFVARLEERRAQILRAIDSTNVEVLSLRNQASRFNFLNRLLNMDLQIYLQHLQSCNNSAGRLLDTKIRSEQDLSNSSRLVVTAQNAVSQRYDDFTQVMKSPNTEYFAISSLLEASEYLGIVGLVQDLIKFERVYERAILAAASDWMRAIVVSDMKSMISVLRYSLNKKLPRFKIIPLDILNYHTLKSEIEQLYENDTIGMLGTLDRFVSSGYSQLVMFLFRDIILVRTSSTGYELARRGFKSVSLSGISFEPSGAQVSIDFGTKIFDMSKTALTTEVVKKLESSARHLSSFVEMKKSNLKGLTNDLVKLEQLEFRAETNITSLQERISSVKESISTTGRLLKRRIEEAIILRENLNSVDSEILTLRQKEQDIIDLTGNSYGMVSEYEQKIKLMRDNERKLSKEYSTLDRDIAIYKRDIEQLRIKYEELTAEIRSLNYEEMPQDLDVDIILEHLNAESGSIRNRVNLRAKDAYSEIVEGYRS